MSTFLLSLGALEGEPRPPKIAKQLRDDFLGANHCIPLATEALRGATSDLPTAAKDYALRLFPFRHWILNVSSQSRSGADEEADAAVPRSTT